ncbi:S41 family peptidase [Dyella japonica]|uniref:Tail specific protease domain-containing protein n=1 Tax=Dyella japonica A8 TaxID=1217721 RepID=A0A075JX53_9GAMM|nr:S41 family peptidase [Dyella japonica]AIF46686.1 hypothetical protein HY57_05125 [Dyella japonica A8]
MRYGWTALGAACLLSFSVHAGDASLQQQYAHIQDLNNTSWRLVSAPSGDPQALAKAVELSRQSLASAEQMKAALRENAGLALEVTQRHSDALRILASAYALQNDREHALACLESLLKEAWVEASTADLLAKNHALDRLRDEPRYKAVIAALGRLDSQWRAPAIATTDTELDEAHRIAGLSLFWSEARYNFVHFELVPDLDWNQAYVDFLPKVIAAKSLHDYYEVMMRFAPLLHDGHTSITPPATISNEFYARPAIRTAMIDGHVLVTEVCSPKLASQVRVGDEVVSVDGQDVRQYAQERVEPYASTSTPQDTLVHVYDYRLLQGDHRQPVTLGLKDAAGRLRQVRLSRENDPSVQVAPTVDWRMLPDGVAYLAIHEFEDDDGVKAFERALPQILHAKGLILDLRRNTGGSDVVGAQILSYLTDRPLQGSRSRTQEYAPVYRADAGPYTAWNEWEAGTFQMERAQRYHGPVVVLVGPRTYSAAEDFVVAFDALKRGTLMGETTGGSTGEPLQFKLPGGGTARICTKHDSFPDGREFVGKGIAPQITVAPTVEDIRAGRDPVIQRALAVLAGKEASPATPAP